MSLSRHAVIAVIRNLRHSIRLIVARPCRNGAIEAKYLGRHRHEHSRGHRAGTLGIRAISRVQSVHTPDKQFSAEIPVRNPDIRGPVNFFRTEYGRWWLIEKTANEHFEQKVPMAKYGHYMLFEGLNFADGKRSVAEIRDLISAEYEPVSVQDVEQYLQFLDSLGVVHLKTQGVASGR